MFKAWVEFSSVLAEERAAEEMRANMSSEKDAQMQKLMARFAGDQKNAMLSLTFGAWKDDTRDSAADRAFQAKLQEQLDSQNADKKNAGMKFAMKMAGGKDEVAKRMTFQAWVDEVKAGAFEKEKKQQMERMVANMVGRNDKQLAIQVIDAWSSE